MASLFPSTVSSYLHKIKLWKFPKHDLNDFRTQMGLKWLRTHLTLSDCSTQERRFCTLSGQYTKADHVNCDIGEPPLRALNAGEAVLKAEERLTWPCSPPLLPCGGMGGWKLPSSHHTLLSVAGKRATDPGVTRMRDYPCPWPATAHRRIGPAPTWEVH